MHFPCLGWPLPLHLSPSAPPTAVAVALAWGGRGWPPCCCRRHPCLGWPPPPPLLLPPSPLLGVATAGPSYRRRCRWPAPLRPLLPLLMPPCCTAATGAAIPWVGHRRAGTEEEGGRTPPLPLFCLSQRPTREGPSQEGKGEEKKERKLPGAKMQIAKSNLPVELRKPPGGGHKFAMAATAHTLGVFFGPLVVQDHIRNGYLTTPTRFGDFPPVVKSPYFLGVIPVVLSTTAKAHEAKLAKEEPQAQEANLIQMFATYAINFVDTPTTGKNRRRKSSKKPTTRGISGSDKSHKTVRVGDLRIRVDGSETLMIPERHVAIVPVKNSFSILPKVRQDKPSFKVKNVKKQWMKAETKNHRFDNVSFKKYKANVEKNEIYSPPRVKRVWVTKEEA
ncbi:hypothetical protein Taro_027572 [Colocasia esculenta]|uniref:Uncharacterized protein n=1 Tax=Colocasia esculenta TaxID=4460 RepID=A0A843VKI1_COLES|nr:hypothetical protein [Colocasia esculenta]